MLTSFIYLEFTAAKAKPAQWRAVSPPAPDWVLGCREVGARTTNHSSTWLCKLALPWEIKHFLCPMAQLTSFFGSLKKKRPFFKNLVPHPPVVPDLLPASSHYHVPPGGRSGARSRHPRGAVVRFQLQGYSIKPVTQKPPLMANPKNTQSTMAFQLPLSSAGYDQQTNI